MKHLFQKGKDEDAPVLLLLHGTGGNEHDLLPVATIISPTSSVLSVRGNVEENGMPRFFKRLAEGIFDEEDLLERTEELYHFIDSAATEYGFARDNVVAVGYSNGANIAGSLLFRYQNALAGAILFHPMVPQRGLSLPNLENTPIFIGAGEIDPICRKEETSELLDLFTSAGADVTIQWQPGGHQLTMTEIEQAKEWLDWDSDRCSLL